MKIKVLPDTVINQIAAGEVVERPASVIRELVDNSVDAGATDIFIAVEAGGHTRLKVRDNGCGMTRDEALLAFERHATSKVSAIEDLDSLSTLGFRGEALASIAAVSKVRLTTRSKGHELGTAVTSRGGKLIDVQSCAWSEGTEIDIEHLFFNTPARRKFLKSPRAELARIRSWVMHSALARPNVRYRLIADGAEILNLAAVADVAARGGEIFAGDLIPVVLREGRLSVEGRVGHPGSALADATGLVLLVNGRLVSDKVMVRAVREGYDSMLKDREFPIGYISLTLPADEVDVNVHPQKSEVRFRHPDQVFAVVRGAVLAGVRSIRRPAVAQTFEPVAAPVAPALVVSSQIVPAPQASFVREAALPSASQPDVRDVWPILRAAPVSVAAATVPQYTQSENVSSRYSRLDSDSTALKLVGEQRVMYGVQERNAVDATFRFSGMRYVGQVLECYLLCEHNEKLVVVDMHAAHERVNYNKIRAQRAARALTVQKLLIPERIHLTAEQVVSLMEQSEVLHELAFEVSQESATEVIVTGVPSVVAHLDCVALVKECAAEPVSAGWRERLEERIDHIAARLACHASVRSGDILKKEEAYALFAQLDEAALAGACPHGRPVVAEFPRHTVERWFGRDR